MATRVRERERAPQKNSKYSKEEIRKDQARMIDLAYRLIELKICYYYPELIKAGYMPGLEAPDAEYDRLDKEYLTICKKHQWANTVSHGSYPGLTEDDVPGEGMFEVDFKRPIVHLIMRKWGVKNWQSKAPIDRTITDEEK